MRESGVVKWLASAGFLLIAVCVGCFIGIHYERSRRTQVPESPTRLASESADMALAVAETGDAAQAAILVRRAIRRADRNPDVYYYLWKVTQKVEDRFDKIASVRQLRRDLLTALDAAMLDSESVDDFGKLYKLSSDIRKRTDFVSTEPSVKPSVSSNAAPSTTKATESSAKPGASSHADPATTKASLSEALPSHPQRHEMSSADPAALLHAGLQSLAEGDEDRAEFLTQAALRSQPDHLKFVPGLWREYKAYLDTSKLTPYDRLARLSAYLDGVDAALLSSRNMTDFQEVWAVRQAVVDTRARSRADLVAEVVHDISDLTTDLKKAAASHDSRGVFGLIASRADLLKPRALIVLATGADNAQSAKSTSDALHEMLAEAVGIAISEINVLKKRTELAAAIDIKGDSVDPASPEKQFGDFEKIVRDARDLANALESADIHSWILMVMPGKESKGSTKMSREIGVTTTKNDGGLDAELARTLASLDQLQAEVARLQGVRYNLWALRSIYGAESNDNWDSVLGRIEVGLLHPTVNALYSITYDTLVRKQIDPQIRARMVQNILNSKKQALSAF
jgi:hypothetical protein